MKNSSFSELDKIGEIPFKREFFNNKEEWAKERVNGLGGSDAGVVVGVNPWKDRMTLWLEKTGKVSQADISDNSAVQYGIEAEEHIRNLFKLDYPNLKVFSNPLMMLRSKEYDWLTYSPDGELLDLETNQKGILEIKTTTIQNGNQFKTWQDMIPQNYYVQVLHGLLVTNYDFVILRALIKTAWDDTKQEIRDYKIKKDEVLDDIDFIFEKEKEFIKSIKDKEMPSMILPEI